MQVSVKEKIQMIASVNEAENPAERLLDVSQAVGGGIGYDFSEKRAFTRVDLRAIIRRRIAEEGLSQREVAKAIGFDYHNFFSFLKGQRGIPFEKAEELLALLDIVK